MPKPSVFLSYSHQDEVWKKRLRTQLKVLEHVGTFEVWDDRRIDTGATWYDEIRQAMDGAAAAICSASSTVRRTPPPSPPCGRCARSPA